MGSASIGRRLAWLRVVRERIAKNVRDHLHLSKLVARYQWRTGKGLVAGNCAWKCVVMASTFKCSLFRGSWSRLGFESVCMIASSDSLQ